MIGIVYVDHSGAVAVDFHAGIGPHEIQMRRVKGTVPVSVLHFSTGIVIARIYVGVLGFAAAIGTTGMGVFGERATEAAVSVFCKVAIININIGCTGSNAAITARIANAAGDSGHSILAQIVPGVSAIEEIIIVVIPLPISINGPVGGVWVLISHCSVCV